MQVRRWPLQGRRGCQSPQPAWTPACSPASCCATTLAWSPVLTNLWGSPVWPNLLLHRLCSCILYSSKHLWNRCPAPCPPPQLFHTLDIQLVLKQAHMMTGLCQTLSVCVTLPCLGAHIKFPLVYLHISCAEEVSCAARSVALPVYNIQTRLPPSCKMAVWFCRESCAQYKAKCCLPEGPLIPDSPAAPAADIVALQWHLQEGSWQDPSSWSVLHLHHIHELTVSPHQHASALLHWLDFTNSQSS